MYKTDGKLKDYNTNANYQRWNYRMNVDFDVTKTTMVTVGVSGWLSTQNDPGLGSDALWKSVMGQTPINMPVIFSNGRIPAAGTSERTNPWVIATQTGYYEEWQNVIQTNATLDQKLDFITKGLSLKLKGAYNSSYSNTKKGTSSAAYYVPLVDDNGAITYRKEGSDTQMSYSDGDFGKARDWYMELALNYNRKFGDHNVSALALYNQSKKYYPGGTYTYIPSGYVGLVGRVTYDWKTRYMAEFNVGYNGSENFIKENRYGFFPAGSVGWVVSEEPFFAPLKKAVGYLKLRASVGLVGNDKNGSDRFIYLPGKYSYGGSDGYFFGQNVNNKVPGAYEASQSLSLIHI